LSPRIALKRGGSVKNHAPHLAAGDQRHRCSLCMHCHIQCSFVTIYSYIVILRLFWTTKSNTFFYVLLAGQHAGLTSRSFTFSCIFPITSDDLVLPSFLRQKLSNLSMRSSARKVYIQTVMLPLETLPRHSPRAIEFTTSSVVDFLTFNFLFLWLTDLIPYPLLLVWPLTYNDRSQSTNPHGRNLVPDLKTWCIYLTLLLSIWVWMTRSRSKLVSNVPVIP
jgi:hypothetical protein